MQLIINQTTKQIICTAFGKGRRHDLFLFKKSKIKIQGNIKLIGDKGYQGVHRYHQASIIPHKKTNKNPLTPEQKAENRQQSRVRVVVKNVIRCLKIFRILSSRYRNRRKRFGLRVNLNAGIYNYELNLATSS
jgi:DDE superfamily endonuclease